MNKPFLDLLKRMEEIHNRKSADYAKGDNKYSNFEFSGLLASKFKHPVDISMAALIGNKLERLSNLLGDEITPVNESIEDNFLDLCTYMALWASYREYKESQFNPPNEPQCIHCGHKHMSGYPCIMD
jgi:hypothetical protein